MKFNTKYFGELDIEVENGDGSAFTSYDGQKLYFYFANFKSYGAKINVCLNVLDRYLQICEMAKAAIVQNFNKNETVRYYFECHFDVLESDTLTEIFGTDEFEKLDVKKIVRNFGYPNLLFGFAEDKKELEISVDFKVAPEYSDEILCVKMDENLNVTDFSHES